MVFKQGLLISLKCFDKHLVWSMQGMKEQYVCYVSTLDRFWAALGQIGVSIVQNRQVSTIHRLWLYIAKKKTHLEET